MTPQDTRILRSLVAVAWADGAIAGEEKGVLDGLITGFGASETEAKDIREYAATSRSLKDVPVAELNDEDREILLGNASLIVGADGKRTDEEKAILDELAKMLGFDAAKTQELIDSAKDGALQLGTRGLEDDKSPGPPPPPKKLVSWWHPLYGYPRRSWTPTVRGARALRLRTATRAVDPAASSVGISMRRRRLRSSGALPRFLVAPFVRICTARVDVDCTGCACASLAHRHPSS
jgi:uncharacterized tellurite resistance protein B-like protein